MNVEIKFKNKKEISNEFDNIFYEYQKYLYDELSRTNLIDYKNILLVSILNRSLSLIEAFKKLMSSNNIMVINSLIRLQIDNCIFAYGVYMLIKNGHNIDEIGRGILTKNKKLNSYTINDKTLSDTYIVSEMGRETKSNIKDAYDFYCRFVHFSVNALFASTGISGENSLQLEMSKDYNKYKKHVIPNANTFIEISTFLLRILRTYWKDIPYGKRMNKVDI